MNQYKSYILLRLTMDRGWSISRYWLVNWDSLVWSWSISSMAFVGNFGNVTGVSVSSVVSYGLGTTIRKEYTVLTRGSITITLFVLTEVGSTVVILNSIFVSVYWRGIFIYWAMSLSVSWSWVVWSWRSCGEGNSQKGGECDK